MSSSARPHRLALLAAVRRLVRAIETDDEAMAQTLLRVSRRRRLFAPLAFAVGALAMLVEGLRVLLGNWRLTLIQIPPAVWIWLAMYDLKAHLLRGSSLRVLHGWPLIPLGLAVVAITAGCFFLNAVFAFAIAGPRPPTIRPAVAAARARLAPILLSGGVLGLLLAGAAIVMPRYGSRWFVLTLGIVIGLMMVSYVAVPSRLIGMDAAAAARRHASRRDRLTASALGGLLSFTVCTPPYLLGRLGILMLGSKLLLVPGIVLLVVGFTLQAGATGAVRAIKMSAALALGRADAPGAR